MFCEWTPDVSNIQLTPQNGLVFKRSFDCRRDYACPFDAATSLLRVDVGDVSYYPSTEVVVPRTVTARNAERNYYGVAPGTPGGAGFTMDLHIYPETVSFQALDFIEEASYNSSKSGYFADNWFSNVWYHVDSRGAGVWRKIQGENFWFRDEAAMGDALKTWYPFGSAP